MSLARTLLNGGYIGSYGCDIDPARYGHAQGALTIATESIEELHEIFLENYNYEQAELAAATEGVALEGSQYEAVAEAAIGDMFKKIKDFFVKLWNKVKAFFAEVRKYIDAIFMSGKEFCKKYDKEIRKLDNLKDFSYKMYEYDDASIDEVDKIDDLESTASELTKPVDNFITIASHMEDGKYGDDTVIGGGSGKTWKDSAAKLEPILKDFKKEAEDDELVKSLTSSWKYKCTTADDFDKTIFALWRNGAESESDKEERDLTSSDIENFSQILQNTKAQSKFNSVQSSSDKMYKLAIKTVEDAEKNAMKVKNSKYASKIAEILRAYSSTISKIQGYTNRMLNSWKTVVKERDSAYKSCIVAAMSNNRKNTKSK